MTTAIGLARLSVDSDESTSIARQRQAITDYCRAQGWELLGIAEDVDVSGKTPVLDRPEAGKLLRSAHADRVVILKLDRVSRSVVGFWEFAEWLDERGSALVSVLDNLDLSTTNGRFVATILAAFAQMERETIGARVREAKRYAREQGRWVGGSVPFGYRAVKNGNGWKVEADPETAESVRSWAKRIIDGESVASVAKDARRHAQSLHIILRAPALGGSDKRVQGPAVLDLETYDALQVALDGSQRPHTKRHDASPLLGVGFCQCGAQLYVQRQQRAAKRYFYAKCSAKCGAANMPLDRALEALEAVAARFDGYDHGTWKTPAKTDRDREVAMIKTALRSLDLDAADYDAKHAKLRDDLKAAQTAPQSTQAPVWVPDGRKFGDVRERGPEGTRRFLLQHEIRVTLWREGTEIRSTRSLPPGRTIIGIINAI